MRTFLEGRNPGPFAQFAPNTSATIGMNGCKKILISIVSHPIRIRFDGTAPTAGVGLYLPTGVYEFDVDPDAEVKIIDTVAGASAVDVQLFR